MTEPKCRVCGGDDRVAPTAFAKLGSTHLCVQCIGLKSRQEIAKLFLCCDKGELLVGHLPIGAVFHSCAGFKP